MAAASVAGTQQWSDFYPCIDSPLVSVREHVHTHCFDVLTHSFWGSAYAMLSALSATSPAEAFPDFKSLMFILVASPVASCERGFSTQSKIKTWASTGEQPMDMLTRIKLYEGELSFHQAAVLPNNQWFIFFITITELVNLFSICMYF